MSDNNCVCGQEHEEPVPPHKCTGVDGAERHGTANRCVVCGRYSAGYHEGCPAAKPDDPPATDPSTEPIEQKPAFKKFRKSEVIDLGDGYIIVVEGTLAKAAEFAARHLKGRVASTCIQLMRDAVEEEVDQAIAADRLKRTERHVHGKNSGPCPTCGFELRWRTRPPLVIAEEDE